MKELYTENNTTLLRDMKEELKTWREISYSWIGRFNMDKMSTFSKWIDPDTVEEALESPEERTRWLIEQSHHE